MRQDVGVDGDAQRISQLCWMFFLKIIDDQDQQLELMQDGLPLAHPGAAPVARLGGRPGGNDRRGIAWPSSMTQLFPALKELPAPATRPTAARVVRERL